MNADNFFGPVILYGLEMKSVMCFHRLIAEIPEILVGNKKKFNWFYVMFLKFFFGGLAKTAGFRRGKLLELGVRFILG